MSVRRDTLDADFVDVIESHVQVLGNVVIISARNEAQLEVAKVDGHSICIELVIRLPDEVKPGADLQLLKGFSASTVTKSLRALNGSKRTVLNS